MFKFKPFTADVTTERKPVVPPQAIIDNFREDIAVQRDFHYSETERLRSLIDDATARLVNHTIAMEACDDILTNVLSDDTLAIAHLDQHQRVA